MEQSDWIYLDNNATSMTDPEVFKIITPYFNQWYGNPASMHDFGNHVDKEIEKAREKVAELLNIQASQIVFTSGATESNGAVFPALTQLYPEKKHIITSAVEHPAVLNNCQYLEKHKGYTVTYLKVDRDGMLDLDELRAVICKDTLLVSIMWANNETGVIFPIEEIVQIAKEKGVYVHSDAVQAVGKVNIDLQKVPLDYLSLSGHKFHAPKGVGVLYIHHEAPFQPLLAGGHQENGRRAGTLNSPGIIGLGEASQLALKHMQKGTYDKLSNLLDSFEERVQNNISHISIHGKNSPRLPNTSNIGFKYIEGESISIFLSQNKIAVSTGSACSSGTLEPSHVLTAMNIPPDELHGSIRFSLSRFTTPREIDKTLEILPSVISTLRNVSPLKPQDE